MTRAEKAKEYFNQGYACSQAVALAFADDVGLTEEQLSKITLPFGGGLGRLRLTCGAVSGMAAMAGLLFAKEGTNPQNKATMYEITRNLCQQFVDENGSLICEDLLKGVNLQVQKGGEPEARSSEYYKKRPCAELVYTAAQILENYLQQTNE